MDLLLWRRGWRCASRPGAWKRLRQSRLAAQARAFLRDVSGSTPCSWYTGTSQRRGFLWFLSPTGVLVSFVSSFACVPSTVFIGRSGEATAISSRVAVVRVSIGALVPLLTFTPAVVFHSCLRVVSIPTSSRSRGFGPKAVTTASVMSFVFVLQA